VEYFLKEITGEVIISKMVQGFFQDFAECLQFQKF
jgi:hypothetical protein